MQGLRIEPDNTAAVGVIAVPFASSEADSNRAEPKERPQTGAGRRRLNPKNPSKTEGTIENIRTQQQSCI